MNGSFMCEVFGIAELSFLKYIQGKILVRKTKYHSFSFMKSIQGKILVRKTEYQCVI